MDDLGMWNGSGRSQLFYGFANDYRKPIDGSNLGADLHQLLGPGVFDELENLYGAEACLRVSFGRGADASQRPQAPGIPWGVLRGAIALPAGSSSLQVRLESP
jgi:hypothetical protein